MPHRSVRHLLSFLLFLTILLPVAEPAKALVRFDFEQSYYVHPGVQTWDFCLLRRDGRYHIFYHGIPVDRPGAANGDTIYHASGEDIRHWDAPVPVITSGTGAWDAFAVWAPDVFRDEANKRWGMAYTGVDAGKNQRIGLAYSPDLETWTPEPTNPVLEPDPDRYIWHPDSTWSDFRDPFVYYQSGKWHLLATAAQWRGERTGVLWHGTSIDLLNWIDVGPLFVNDDAASAGRVLESPQYHILDGSHHLLFGLFDTIGASHVRAGKLVDLTMDDRAIIGNDGYAPELDAFDAGHRMLSRIVPYYDPDGTSIRYVVRIDSVRVGTDGGLTVHAPHPLDRQWEYRSGLATVSAPTFGDNPVWRGEPGVGLRGNSFYSSREYHRGPLSGYGYPGFAIGDGATGMLYSKPFTVDGTRMDLLVGGGNDPDNVHVALVDAVTDSILRLETGNGSATMTARAWDLTDLAGRLCKIRILDQSNAVGGFINVDEIIESGVPGVTGVADAAPARPILARAVPNPANPRTEIRFGLAAGGTVTVTVHDLRGRLVWSSTHRHLGPGEGSVAWQGLDTRGRAAPTGVYVYRVHVDGRVAAQGKLALVR